MGAISSAVRGTVRALVNKKVSISYVKKEIQFPLLNLVACSFCALIKE